MQYITKEKLFALIDFNGRVVVNIMGAVIYLHLSAEIYTKSKLGDLFIGYVDLLHRRLVEPTKVGNLKGHPKRKDYASKEHDSDYSNSKQSDRQPIDAFLCRCKHQLKDVEGICLGEQGWDASLDEATNIYNLVHGTDYPRSKDTKIWARDYKKS